MNLAPLLEQSRVPGDVQPSLHRPTGSNLKTGALLASIGVISFLHYSTGPPESLWHAVYQHLYHVPVIFGAYWFGLRGGLVLATIAALAYLPHIGGFHDQDSRFALSQYTELLLLFIVGATVGVLASAQRRLTNRYRETAESLRNANRELTESHEEVRRADRLTALGQIAASLAHELRNPIAAITGAIEIVSSRVTPGTPEAEFAGLADTEIRRLDALLNDFLAYARPRDPQFVATGLGDVVQHVLALLRPTAERSAVTFTTHLDPGERRVRADREQIEQVLFNIILNAIHASPPGGTVSVRETARDGVCELAVSDEGPGIRPELSPRIFEPFFTTKKHGSGLGLPTANRIIEAHGGRIELSAVSGSGTVFRIVLPLLAEQARSR